MKCFTYLLTTVALVIASSGGLGCSKEPDPPDAAPTDTLRASFPEQAAEVLEHEEAFVATEEGFVLGAPDARGAWRGWDVELPRDGGGVIRMRGFGGAEVRMREIDIEGDFLGFTHYCGKNRAGRFWVVRRTSRKKRQAKLAKLREELRRRRHASVIEQHRRLRENLRGHYGYYVCLQRRSQKARWTNERRTAFDRRFPLPPPRITRRPSPQLCLPLTGGGSPVREIRSPGSVRGAG